MAKSGFASCSDGAAAHHTVFIDTSLDTHLAMIFLDGDTVSVLKDKIEKEHPLCFPHLGNIIIHALMVKRKGYFYHLSDSMYLKSAFVGVNKSWFLYIDASSADDHSTGPHTGNLLSYFGMANHSIGGIKLARNSHSGQTPNHDSPSLPVYVAQQFLDDKATSDSHFGSGHSSKTDLIVKKAEVLPHSVENCSKVHLGGTGNACEDLNEPLESLPAGEVTRKSKKRKKILMIEHAFEGDKHSMDGNAQNPLQQDIESHEQLRDFDCRVSDLPMMGTKSNADEPCRSLSSNTHNESEYGLNVKYNLSEETRVPSELDGKNDNSTQAVHLKHNSSLEEAVQAGPTGKKMLENGKINEVKDLEGNKDLVPDSNKVTSKPEVASNYLYTNKQTGKVVLDSLSTELEAHLLETGSNELKRKKKKRKVKLSDYPNQAVGLVLSKSGAPKEVNQESDITTVPSHDIEDAPISKVLEISTREKHYDSNHKSSDNFEVSLVGGSDVNMNDRLVHDVQSMKNTSKKAMLGVNGTTDSQTLAFFSKDPSSHLARVAEPTTVTLEERDSMQNADTKATMVENCQFSSWDGTDINAKATQISESQQLVETAKTTKGSKKKKTRKFKDSAEGSPINLVATGARESAQGISSTKLHSIESNNSSSKAETGEANISLMKGESRVGASILPTDKNINIDETNKGKVEPLLQMNNTQTGEENVDEVGKEFKNQSPVTLTKSMSDYQGKDIGNEDSLPPKSNPEVKSVSKMAKKTKLPKVKSKKEAEEANLDSTKKSEVESCPPSTHMQSTVVGSSLLPSHASGGKHGERSIEANMYSNTCKVGDKDDNHVEVSCESNIDIEERARQLQPESVEMRVGKLSREKIATALRLKRKKKDHNLCSSGTSLSLQNVTKSDENAESESGRRQTSNSSSLKLKKLSSKDKCDGTLPFNNKVNKMSKDGVESLPDNNCEQNTANSDRAMVGGDAIDTSLKSAEKISEALSVPRIRINLQKSKNMVCQDQKHVEHRSTVVGHLKDRRKYVHAGNRDVTRAERKNLLSTSGGIFKDASSGSSGGEDIIADSGATRSPDNSLSSDFSDGDSKADMDASENGSVDLKRKNIHGRSTRDTGFSSPENMNLGTILRSSSRYKKARLTAAQSQLEETESQPVDVVPDTQPDL